MRGLKNKVNSSGFVMLLVMGFVLLMSMVVISFSSMIRRDMELIARSKSSFQALNLAEAGIRHAIARLNADGISAASDFTRELDTGKYDVTFSKSGLRRMVTSTGIPKGTGISRTVAVEINRAPFPPALTRMFTGGCNIRARALGPGSAMKVIGDIHANNDIHLMSPGTQGVIEITGEVASAGTITEGNTRNSNDPQDTGVFINGLNNDEATVYEGRRRVRFPRFDYDVYRDQAIDSGDYYSGDTTFTDITLTPGNGVVYVDGDVTFRGTSVLNGGIVASNIYIDGSFDQKPHSTDIRPSRNFVLAKDGEIDFTGRLGVEEAIVYAKTDIEGRAAFTEAEIFGIVMAENGNMKFWHQRLNVYYEYKLTYPCDLDMGFDYDEDDEIPGEKFQILNWIR